MDSSTTTNDRNVMIEMTGAQDSEREPLAPRPSRKSCGGWTLAALALLAAIAGGVLGGALVGWAREDPAPEIVLSRSPVPPEGYNPGHIISSGAGEWVAKRDMPFSRSDAGVVSSDSAVYIVGGLNETGHVQSSVITFDPVFEQYNLTAVPPMPEPRYRAGIVLLKNHLVVAGGYASEDGEPVATTLVLDLSTLVWNNGPAMAYERGDVAATVVNDHVVVFGGYGLGYDMSNTGQLVEAWDLASSVWERRADMPTSRGDVGAVTSGDIAVVTGGWNDATDGFLDTAEAYHWPTDEWRALPPLPVARGDKAMVTLDRTVLLIGGEVWSGKHAPCPWDETMSCKVNEVPLHDVIALSPRAGLHDGRAMAWVPREPLPEARFRFAAVEVNDVVWVFGGQSHGSMATADVWAFYDVPHDDVWMHTKK